MEVLIDRGGYRGGLLMEVLIDRGGLLMEVQVSLLHCLFTQTYHSASQQEHCAWWVGSRRTRGEWRYAATWSGGLCVMTSGVLLTVQWRADNWATATPHSVVSIDIWSHQPLNFRI